MPPPCIRWSGRSRDHVLPSQTSKTPVRQKDRLAAFTVMTTSLPSRGRCVMSRVWLLMSGVLRSSAESSAGSPADTPVEMAFAREGPRVSAAAPASEPTTTTDRPTRDQRIPLRNPGTDRDRRSRDQPATSAAPVATTHEITRTDPTAPAPPPNSPKRTSSAAPSVSTPEDAQRAGMDVSR